MKSSTRTIISVFLTQRNEKLKVKVEKKIEFLSNREEKTDIAI